MNRTADSTTDASEHLRYVFIEKARCPRCGADRLKTIRSKTEGGAVTRRTVCQVCQHRFFVILE